MSCYIPYKDLESTLYAAYRHDFNKYKDLSAVIDSVMSLSIEPEAKIHAVWFYSGFINTAAYNVAELQTPEWSKGVYSAINNYLKPFLTGEQDFDFDSIVSSIGEFLAKPVEMESESIQDSVLSDISDVSKLDDSELNKSIGEIIEKITSNKDVLDPAVLDPNQTSVKALLDLLLNTVSLRKASSSRNTAINLINNAIKITADQQSKSIDYVDLSNTLGIGIANGVPIQILRRANGEQFEVTYDKVQNVHILYDPTSDQHQKVMNKLPGDQMYAVYNKDNAFDIDPDTLNLRMHRDQILTGLTMEERYIRGNDVPVQDEMSQEAMANTSFYSYVRIKATTYSQQLNRKRLQRIQKAVPNRQFETKERPKQSKALSHGESPIITYIRPVDGFTVTISNFKGDKSFDLLSFTDIAFVYPDNTVVKVDFDNPAHIELLKANISSDLNTPSWRATIDTPKYTPITDEQIKEFKTSVERYKKFSQEVQERIDNSIELTGSADIDIRDIFFKYYDISNNAERIELVKGAKPTGTLGEYIDKNDGELPVTIQYYDEEGNPKGEAVREKLPIVLRKNRGVWEMVTTLPEGQRLVAKNGTQYRDVLLYLEEGEGIKIREFIKNKFNNSNSLYIGFKTQGNQLKPVIAPLLYQRQAQQMSDVVDIISGMQYSFSNASIAAGNNFMVQFDKQGWGFDVRSQDTIKPQIVVLNQKNNKKTFGIEFKMLGNSEDERNIFNTYSNSNMNIPFNDELLYGSNGVFTRMNELYKAADVTIPENADLSVVTAAANKAIQKLGDDNSAVIALKDAYRNLIKDIKTKFKKIINEHDLNLSQGKISRSLISDSFREYGLFDDASLKLYKRGQKPNMMESFYKLETLNTNKLNLTYRDPAKTIILPASSAAAAKIDISTVGAPVVIVPAEQVVPDPSVIAEPGEFIDPNLIKTDNSDIPFSVQQSLEAFFTLSDENLSAEIAAMKALIPGVFEFTGEGFEGLNVDGHVLGYVQGMMIHINNTLKAKGVAYHEGFHAIFRNLLTSRQQSYYLSKAREVLGGYKTDSKGNYIQVGSKKVYANEFRKERRYLHLNDEQIQHLIYEEYLADSFAEFMETNKVPKTWMEKLFTYLKKLVNYFKKGGKIDNLFYDISLGKFRNATVQETKPNVETVYSIAYSGIPYLTKDANNVPVKRNAVIQSFVVNEVKDKMIYEMAKLKGGYPQLKPSELYDLAKQKVLSSYQINDLIAQVPSKEADIKQAYGYHYQNARWMLGTFADGIDKFSYLNLTKDSQYDNRNIDPSIDKEQVATNKSVSDKFKDQLLKDFESIYVDITSDEIDEQLLDEMLENFTDDEEIGESFKDTSFVSIAPNDGTAAFRKLFKYIPYPYTDPILGVTRTKMVDSKLIFSTIRKITANLPKEEIVNSIVNEVLRLDSDIDRFNTKLRNKLVTTEIPSDIANKITLRDSLNAVLNTLSEITDMDSDGSPKKNRHVLHQFRDVFNTVDIKLMQIEMLTRKKYSEEEKKLQIVGQDITLSDIVIWGDINKIRGDLKERLYGVKLTAEQAKPFIDSLNEIAPLFRNINSIKDRFFTESGMLNDEAFENYIDDVYVNLSAFNLNIPYDVISISFAYNIFKLSGGNTSIFSSGSKYRSLLKANKAFFKSFNELGLDFFSLAIPNAIKKSIELNSTDKIKSEDLDTLIRRVTAPYVNTMGEFILKYDPTIGGSVARNANGDLVNKYVKPTPAYQTWIKLHNSEDISEGLDNIIQEYFPGFEEFFEGNPILNTDTVENRFFLENFNVYAFAGFQQKFDQFGKIQDGASTTFGQIDDRAYLLSMLGMFTQKKQTRIPGTDKVIITFPRILNQYEATSTSLVVDAKYTKYFEEGGKAVRTKSGVPVFVNDLMRVLFQEYSLMKKNFYEFNNKSASKLYKDYNVNPEKDRGFTFNILADFFESRPDLKDHFISAARSGQSIENLLLLVPDVINQTELQLEEYGKEQLNVFVNTINNLGVEVADLPTTVDHITFIRDMFFNNWINGIFVNQLFDGPIAVGVKGPADYFKRQKSGAAAGSNIYIAGGPKTYRAAVATKFIAYINNDDLSANMQFTPFLNEDGTVAKGNKAIEIFDGQTVNTVDRRMKVADSQGQLDPEAYMFLHRMKYITISDKLYKEGIQKLAERGIVFNSLKTVSAAGLQYLKQSEHTLIRKDVSHLRSDLDRGRAFFDLEQLYNEADFYSSQLALGNNLMTVDEETGEDVSYEEMYKRTILKAHSYFVANKGRELLHNMLNSMEMSRVDQFMDGSSSKRATVLPIEYNIEEASKDNYYFDLEEGLEEVPNDLTYVQVSTTKVATSVTQGIQQKLLAITQLDPNSPEYADIKKDIDNYQKGLADAVRAQTLWTIKLLTSSDKNVVSQIYTMISDGLREQGADSTVLQWFELEPDGTNKYNPNMAVLSSTLAYYYFSIFNKGIFDKKIAGRKYYHISPLGYKIIEQDGQIITQDEYKKNPGKYKNATTRYPSITKLEDGKYVAEVIVPKELRNVDQKFLEEYLAKKLFFATRIPTEDKRSMMIIKIVDYIDEAYGAGIIVPYQLHMLSGSDFDIDALYAHIYSSYISPDGSRVAYGDYTLYKEKYGMSDEEAKFIEYLAYIGKNSLVKPFLEAEIAKFKQQAGYKKEQARNFGAYFGGKINDYFTENADMMTEESELEERNEIINNFRNIIATFNVLQTLKDSDLPSTPSALTDYIESTGTTPVVDLIFNNILESKVNILSNETVFNKFFADPKNRADAAAAPYEELVRSRGLSEKELYSKQNMFTPTALIVARSLNSESKDSLGIAASFNKGVSMLASISATLKKGIGTIYLTDDSGKISSKIETNKIVDDAVQLVGGAIGLFADAPKNPYPGPLNLNKITTPVMLAMFSVGIPHKAAIMFQSFEPIVNAIRDYNQEYGSFYSRNINQFNQSFTKFLTSRLSALSTELLGDLVDSGVLEFKDKMPSVNKSAYKLIWTGQVSPGSASDIFNLGFKLVNSKGATFSKEVEDFILLTEFSNYQALGADISFKVTALTDAMKGVKPDQDRFDRLINTYNTVEKESMFSKDSIVKLFERYPVLQENKNALEMMDTISKQVLMERTSFMKGLTSLFDGIWEYKKPDVRKDLKAFIQLQLQRALIQKSPKGLLPEIYSSQLDPFNFINGDVVTDWMTLRAKYPDNTFLQAIKPVTEGRGVSIRMLETSVSKFGSSQKDQIFPDMLFLLGGPLDVKEKAFRIAYHGMIKSGAQKIRGGYYELLPAILSKPMSDALSQLQSDLIELDQIANRKSISKEKRKIKYNAKLDEIVNKNFGDTTLDQIITDAVTKLIGTRLMNNTSASFKRTVSLTKLNSKYKISIPAANFVSFIESITPGYSNNIVSKTGTRPTMSIPTVQRADLNEIELFTPTGNKLVLDFSSPASIDYSTYLTSAFGIKSAPKNTYKFPLYRTNIYGQMLVLKSIDGKSIGQNFIDTLSETIDSPTSEKLELSGKVAEYEVVAQQGTPKISPLAFTNQEATVIRNAVLGLQQIGSQKVTAVPRSFTIVRTSNRAYEIRSEEVPSGNYKNSTFTLLDMSQITTGDKLDRYKFVKDKLYRVKNNVGNGVLIAPERYDSLAEVLGSPDWETLSNNPKFTDFIAGKSNVFVYDLISGDPESPTAQPSVSENAERTEVIKEKEKDSKECN